jgi:hypothetical protein
LNVDIHLPNGGLYSPNPPTEIQKRELKNRLSALLEEIPVFKVSGSLKYMAASIDKVISREE